MKDIERTEEMTEEKEKEKDIIREKLREEIYDQFETIRTLSPGSKEMETMVNCIEKLYRLEMEEKKIDRDIEKEEIDKKKLKESILARKESDKQKKMDIFIRNAIGVLESVFTFGFYSVWMRRGFQFEKDGVLTSQTFKNLIHNFKPKK